jgi:hypothetical protein
MIICAKSLQNEPLFLISGNQLMSSCKFREIIVFDDFQIENGVLGLYRHVYLSVVKFLNSSVLRKV